MYWTISLSSEIHLKIFPDILVYYLFIYLISIIAILGQIFPNLRTFLSTRPRDLWIMKKLDLSIGEGLIVNGLILLVIFQFVYFYLVCFSLIFKSHLSRLLTFEFIGLIDEYLCSVGSWI